MEHLLIINSIIIWLVLLSNVLLTFALIRKVNWLSQMNGRNTPPMQSKGFLEVGQAAPDFEAKTLAGDPVTLANFAQRKVVFLFMSPNCGTCRDVIQTLASLEPQAKQHGVLLTLVITSERERAEEFVKESDVNLPALVTPAEGKFILDYKVLGTPFYSLIDEQGYVEATGFFDRAWQSLIDKWSQTPGQVSTPHAHQ